MTDRQTDGGDCNIPDAFLKKRGDKNSFKITGAPNLRSLISVRMKRINEQSCCNPL